MKYKLLIILMIIVTILVGCSATQDSVIEDNNPIESNLEEDQVELNQDQIVDNEVDEPDEIAEINKKDKVIEDEKIIDYNEIRPNEAGRVMVIMYHSLGEKESNYVSTPDILRQNLKDLYDRGYVSVRLEDFVNNAMDIPAGKTPVVLTFDDGHISNFRVIEENGELKVDPNSAVGIIDSFYEEHKDFNRAASFSLNSNISFSQNEYKEYKLNYLIDHGYDISSHSYGHEKLAELNASQIQKSLGKNVNSIESILTNYSVNTLALPFGIRPKDPSLEKFVYEGIYDSKPYEFIAVLNVGWNPTYSPIHKNFNYKSINRVQSGSGEFQLSYWIEYFEKNPDKKYVSDGIKTQITIPKSIEENIDRSKINDKKLVIYERNKQ